MFYTRILFLFFINILCIPFRVNLSYPEIPAPNHLYLDITSICRNDRTGNFCETSPLGCLMCGDRTIQTCGIYDF